MKFLLSFYKNMPARTLVMYIFCVLLFLINAAICLGAVYHGYYRGGHIMRIDGFPGVHFMFIFLSWFACFVFLFFARMLAPECRESKVKSSKAYFSRTFYALFISTAANLACALAISLVITAIAIPFHTFGAEIAKLVSCFVLYLFYILITSRIAVHNGSADTTHKCFNPHLNNLSWILAHVFYMPLAADAYMRSFNYGSHVLNPQIFTAYIPGAAYLGVWGFFISYALLTLLSTFIFLLFYHSGRNAFYKKHPRSPEYDAESIKRLIKTPETKEG